MFKPQRASLSLEVLKNILRVGTSKVLPNSERMSFFLKLAARERRVAQRDWGALSAIVRRRREFEIDHEVAGLEVRNLLKGQKFGSKWKSSRYFDAVMMLQSAGLFLYSLYFHRQGLAKFEAEVEKFGGTRKTLGLAQLAIQTGNLELARDCLSRLGRNRLTPYVPPVKAVFEYLTIWLDGESGRSSEFNDASDEHFSSLVKEKHVHLVGPADSGEIESSKQPNSVTVGILRPTGAKEVSAGNTKDGVPFLAYSNFNTVDFLRTLDGVRLRSALSTFSAVVFKTSVFAEIDKYASALARTAGQISALFIYGNPNMVQVAAIDLLQFSPSAVFVSGVNFFVGDYREDQRRYDHNRSVLSDTSSSTGEAFEVCSALGQHGALENRNVIKNLQMHNRLVGDQSFESSLSLTDEQYLEALELKYGRNGI